MPHAFDASVTASQRGPARAGNNPAAGDPMLTSSEVPLSNGDVTTMPMATFIRDYAAVLDEVESTDDALVLERRAGRASFVLAPLRRVEGDRYAIATVAQILRHALRSKDVEKVVTAGLVESYPWTVFLPAKERAVFERELLDVLRACAAIGCFTAFEGLVDSWQATAEIWSDPALARRASRPVDVPYGGDVPAPVGAGQRAEASRRCRAATESRGVAHPVRHQRGCL